MSEMDGPHYSYGGKYPEDINEDDLLAFTDKNPFHIGQCYEENPAKQIKCKKCGATQFHVAQGNYYTAIRCSYCKWELCIHNG